MNYKTTLTVPRTIDEVISNLNDFNLICLEIPKQTRDGIRIVVEGDEESINEYTEHLDAEQSLEWEGCMSEGIKHDADKPRYDLMPFGALDEVAKVLSFGAVKYPPDNWKKVPELERRYLAAAMRHISAHCQGNELDDESGLAHLAHAITGLMFVIQNRIDTEGKILMDTFH